jgi:hypothetical protein
VDLQNQSSPIPRLGLQPRINEDQSFDSDLGGRALDWQVQCEIPRIVTICLPPEVIDTTTDCRDAFGSCRFVGLSPLPPRHAGICLKEAFLRWRRLRSRYSI